MSVRAAAVDGCCSQICNSSALFGIHNLNYWQLPIDGEARRDKNEKSLMLSYTILQLPLYRRGTTDWMPSENSSRY